MKLATFSGQQRRSDYDAETVAEQDFCCSPPSSATNGNEWKNAQNER
jgi:hypothetical protein